MCAEGPDTPVVPGATYAFTAGYRTEYGQTPVFCLLELPSQRCADVPLPVRSADWQTVSGLVRPSLSSDDHPYPDHRHRLPHGRGSRRCARRALDPGCPDLNRRHRD